MKKPERVEVGQWWLIHGMPHRIDAVDQDSDKFTTMHGPVTHGSDGVCVNAHAMWTSVVMDVYEYLGSGDHPEPSGWMIETLVNAMSEIENGGPALDEPSRGRFDRTNYRQIVRDAIDGKSHDLTYTRCVGVIYRLLRSLGKW